MNFQVKVQMCNLCVSPVSVGVTVVPITAVVFLVVDSGSCIAVVVLAIGLVGIMVSDGPFVNSVVSGTT